MRTPKLALVSLLALLPLGCATGRRALATGTNLELERVVLYRNGVGYFERQGQVDDSVLRIRVRRDQINDLLKSLTVVDKNGQAVSVSMPLDPDTWAAAALSALTPGRGRLAELLDGLRGTEVSLHTTLGRIRGRVVLVERIVDEPDPDERSWPRGGGGGNGPSQRDYKITLMKGADLRVVRLSKVNDVTLHDGDLAMQLHRRLDASSGEGMFQQVEVAIRLIGAKQHDVRVSYVVSAPMWKPTYRVVLPEDGQGKALLQGWAVVDNTSGEDWSEVVMGLTSGEPIAFRYDLHTPRTVPRSDLTEAGVRKRATVAMGETTYGGFDDEEPEELEEAEAYYGDDMDADMPVAAADEAGPSGGSRYGAKLKKKSEARAREQNRLGLSGTGRGGGGAAPASSPAQTSAVDLDALRRSTLADARAKQVSGMTRYDLEERVTVPNGSSTMVAILNRDVEAEQTFLYRPGGAGIGYDANPYRVVRFVNSTPFVLEPGPIAIYSGNSFVGEGISEAVSTGTSATIPFAVEPSILVSSKSQYTGGQMHLLKISRGVLEVESFSKTTTTWSVKGKKADKPYRVLVRHQKAGWNYELVDPPKDTEVLPDAYLIPVSVAKGRTEGSLEVVEQTPSQTTISIWDGRALELLETLVISAELTPELKAKIQPVVDLRREIGRIDTEIDGLKRQQVELNQRANETRQNLEAIKKDPAANALRKKLSKRLDEFTSEGDRIGRRIVELQSQRLEKKIALEDLLENLELTTPRAKKGTKGKKKGK